MQLLAIRLILAGYMQLSGIKPTSALKILGIKPILEIYIHPPGIGPSMATYDRFGVYITLVAYI